MRDAIIGDLILMARERRPGQRGQRAKRAPGRGQWRDAKGFRLYLMAGERIIHLLSWHQGQNEWQHVKALDQGKEAGWLPEDQVQLCVVCDGASWIWQHVKALFPQARHVLDSDHCATISIRWPKRNRAHPCTPSHGLKRR